MSGYFRVAIVLFLLAACSYRVQRDPGVLVIGMHSDPSTLNPVTYTDAGASEVLYYLNDSLIDRNPETLEWRPKLAERWEISDDHLKFTFFLRKNVKWHDGRPFTADDVVYSYERIMDPGVDAAQQRVYYKDIERVEKIDDSTVRFVFREPYYKAFGTAGGISLAPKHVFDDGTDFNKHPAGRHPIGTGPYRFVEWVTSRRIVLARNTDYWRIPPAIDINQPHSGGEGGTQQALPVGGATRAPVIDGILFRIIPEPSVAFQALKKGEIDYGGMRAIQYERQTVSKKFLERFGKYRFFTPAYAYIGWNSRRSYFSDRRVRRALTMLIDRQRILDKILYGQGMMISGGRFPFHPSYDPDIKPWPYDPAQAALLLDEAGWSDHDGDGVRDKDGIPFGFTLLYTSGSRLGDALASIMREEFRKVGIGVEAQQIEWTAFLKNINDRAFDAMLGGWGGGDPEEDPYQIWHSSQGEKGSNHVGFANAEADRLIEEARREFDPAKRVLLYRKFHRILHEEEPYTFLYCLPELSAVDRRFTNVKAYKMGMDPMEWGVKRDVILWQ